MTESTSIKHLIGRDVDVASYDGACTRGRLLNVCRRSLWLVTDGEDRIIPLTSVAELRDAS